MSTSYIGAGLTTDEILPSDIVASLDQLGLDKPVSAVRWTKCGTTFSLFIGLYSFCGHLRWCHSGFRGDTILVKSSSPN